MGDISKIRSAFETKLAELSENIPTAWQNTNFKVDIDNPWQEAWLMLAKPENPTMGDEFYRQRGYLQIILHYPANTGPADAEQRASFLRESFKRGLSLENGGVTVVIAETPEISGGSSDSDGYRLNVYITFFANIF